MKTTRRQFLTTSSALAAAAFARMPLLAQAPAQQPAGPPPTAFTTLRRNVGIFTGSGGTIGWLVAPAGVIVVDTQMPATAGVCLAGIDERAARREIDVVFNTHHHGDHTGGNGVFKPRARRIVAHARVPELQKAAAKPESLASQVYADTTFTDRFEAKIGDETVHAVHLGAAHTGGDSVVFFEQANIVHVGDLVFNRRLPVTDRPGGCTIVNWVKVLERIANGHNEETLYIFGHAKQGLDVTGRKADVLFQRDFLSALLDHVRAQIKAGNPREQIVRASIELKGFPDHGALSERVLGAAYDELTGA